MSRRPARQAPWCFNYFLNRSGCEFRFAFDAFVRVRKKSRKSPHAPTPLLSCPVSCPDRTIKAVQRQCGWSLTQMKPAGIAAHATSCATLSHKQVQNPSMLHCQMSNTHVATILAVTFALPCTCRSSRPSPTFVTRFTTSSRVWWKYAMALSRLHPGNPDEDRKKQQGNQLFKECVQNNKTPMILKMVCVYSTALPSHHNCCTSK